MPQSVQLIGSRYWEVVCLQAAQILEERLGTFAPRPAEQLAHV